MYIFSKLFQQKLFTNTLTKPKTKCTTKGHTVLKTDTSTIAIDYRRRCLRIYINRTVFAKNVVSFTKNVNKGQKKSGNKV